MIHEESAQVGDKTPPGVGKNLYHAIRDAHTMRAASSSERGIKIVSDESDIGNAADESIRAAAIQSRHSLNIYGAHLDITMPNGSAFDVIGGELGLFPNALGPPGFEPGTKGL